MTKELKDRDTERVERLCRKEEKYGETVVNAIWKAEATERCTNRRWNKNDTIGKGRGKN